MSLCHPWTWRVTSADGGRWWEFESPDWEFEYARKQPGDADVTVSKCGRFEEFVGWCDRLEVWCGSELAERFVLEDVDVSGEDTVRLRGTGLAALVEEKRRWSQTRSLAGSAGQLWVQLWAEANGVAATGLGPGLLGGGPALQLSPQLGDKLDGTLGTLGTYITWTQHRGALYDWLAGNEPNTGRTLDASWVAATATCVDVGQVDADSMATDLLFAYTPSLVPTHTWTAPDADDCYLQSGRLEFPEITNLTDITALAETWGPQLAAPEPVLDSVDLIPSATCLDDLLPGVWHDDNVTGHAGYRFNLATAVVSGQYDCVTSVQAGFDQGDNEVRRRLLG